jgi:hypothetical protein
MLCFHAFVQYPTLANVDIRPSPASLLHTRDVASKSVQSELELHTTVSIRATGSHDYTTTHSCHAEVPQYTSSLCAHNTAVLDLCWAGVAVHLAELELGLRARTLGQGGVANDIAKSLSVWLSVRVLQVRMRPILGNAPSGDRRRPTSPARAVRRPCAWCGRACS